MSFVFNGRDMERDERLYQLAIKRVEEKRSFFIHLAAYILVNGLFWTVYFWNGGGGFPWPAFISFFWGIGVAAHFIEAFFVVDEFDSAVDKEYKRMLDRKNGR